MAPLNTSVAQTSDIASLASQQEWPCLGLEADWKLVEESSGNVVAFEEFPTDSDSDSERSPSWAARAAKVSCKEQVKRMQPLRRRNTLEACLQEKVCESEEKDLESTEDEEQLLDSKLLAREAHCRQASRGGRHTVRTKGHASVSKSSDVAVIDSGEAAPEAVAQVAQVLRQTPVKDVVRFSGGSCKLVKTKEGRQTSIAGAMMYDVTVPMSGPEVDNVEVTYRVVEDGRGGAISKVRHPKYSAANHHRSRKNSRNFGDLEHSKQVSHGEVMEGLALAKLL